MTHFRYVKGTSYHVEPSNNQGGALGGGKGGTVLLNLRLRPGNRLTKLSGKREGQYSIHDHEQGRVSCRWKDAVACEVELSDTIGK